MRRSIISALAYLLASTSMGQNAIREGIVTDEANQPVAYANVVCVSLPDSSFITGTVTDIDGLFLLETDCKECLVKVSSVGYKTTQQHMLEKGRTTIVLHSTDVEIEEVEVKAQLPKTHITGTSMITSIEGTVLGKSGAANDMLAKVPGMMKGKDGLEVIGRGAPVIYINGRKIHDLEELKRLRSEEIRDIEVITNPGAQYDATVNAVVRIRTKKRQGDGFGFDFTSSYNYNLEFDEHSPSETVNLRYRHNSVELFGMFNYWNWNNTNINNPRQYNFIRENGKLVSHAQKGHLDNVYRGCGLNYNLGFDWQIGDNHSVGARIEKNDKIKGESQIVMDEDYYTDNVVTDYIVSDNLEKEDKPLGISGNLYYTGMIGKLGIDLNLDYMKQKQKSTSAIFESTMYTETTMTSNKESENNMLAYKLVFSYPMWKGRFLVGSECSLVGRNQEYTINSALPLNSSSKVHEKNFALFAEYNFAIENVVNGSVGVRYEHVGFDYNNNLDQDGSFDRYSDEIFPSVSLMHNFGAVVASFSYSVKTSRPNYWMLSDSKTYINKYSLEGGNSLLKNSINQSVGLNIHYQFLNLNVTYERVDDALSQWTYLINDEGTALIKNINIDVPVRQFVAFVNASPTLGVYHPNLTAGFVKVNLDVDADDPRTETGKRVVKFRKPIGIFRLNNTFCLKKSWQFEANVDCMTKGDFANAYLTSFKAYVEAGVQKCWLQNDALCLRVMGQNLTKIGQNKILLDNGCYELNTNFRNCAQINASLRYTFNASQSKYRGTGAGKDAADRMKN